MKGSCKVAFFYNLIVKPLVLVIEVLYMMMYKLLNNGGLAIAGVSLIINFLILPLYRRADAVQEEERNKQESMKHWVTHIKRTFKGDERYMMLQNYYRQQNYHPLYALKSSVSLLLQIPFFIAAYQYLSGLPMLKGMSFGPIRDLSAPDGLLTVFGLTINVLPILMTVINLISGAIYSKGLPLSSKLQQTALTILFLVLLYDRPAGLVMYWTLNNLFSLVKNLFFKVLKHPKEIFACLTAAFGVCLLFLLWRKGVFASKRRLAAALLIFLAALLPMAKLLLDRFLSRRGGLRAKREAVPIPHAYFIISGILLTLLIGFVIPLAVVSDSPWEFADRKHFINPIRFALSNTVIMAGFFLLWGNIFYLLSTVKTRRIFTFLYWTGSVAAIISYMFFGRNLGDISTNLNFDKGIRFSRNEKLLNLAVLLAAAVVCVLIFRYGKKLIPRISVIAIIGLIVLSGSSILKMNKAISARDNVTSASEVEGETVEPLFRLSKTGKNVIVLMMDRAIGSYVPYIMKQRPELVEKFDGFTWYPNTISYGQITNYGSPALFGGYEYTPVEMNRRSDELLVDKQNELLKMLPVLYMNEGYEVTVCDPPYAGYKLIPDMSIFDEYPQLHAYYLNGKFTMSEFPEFLAEYETIQKRNFVFYSFLKAAPVILQPVIYNDGEYYTSSDTTAVPSAFLNAFSVLLHLRDFTEITEEDANTLLCFTNKSTHDDTLLQMPDFELSLHVDNSDYFDQSFYEVDGVTCKMLSKKGYSTGQRFKHFCVNVRSYMELGKWFDYMRENGVYDNTRIIIASDHGYKLGQFKNLIFFDGKLDTEMFDCLLMVKDFNATGFSVSNEFMTNADVPSIAVKDTIANPVNPFTGKEINSDEKTAHRQEVTTAHNWNTNKNNGTQFKAYKETWYGVSDDKFLESNWVRCGSWKDTMELLAEEGRWP